MMLGWLQSPMKSGSPATDALVAIFAFFIALATGATFLVAMVVMMGILKATQWYVNRPIPTDRLYAETQQRSIAANFPDTVQFMDAYVDRLIDALRGRLPTYHVFRAMAQIAELLYNEERLNNPLPPLPPANTIEEGRYRDQLIAHQRKTVDAPGPLRYSMRR
jgi:hypothetical protein